MVKILQWNARSLTMKKECLTKYAIENNFEILCLMETWLDKNHPFNIKQFNTFRTDRNRRAGGTAIAVKKPYLSQND